MIPTAAPAFRQLGRGWDCCFCIEPPALRSLTFSHNNPAAFSDSSRMPSIFGVTPLVTVVGGALSSAVTELTLADD